ncbi:beta-ketoacyl-[acyl-carrier-protein] synthase family protein [Blattabacterium cuenoti]|nr:hypothetical protein [Blattabacterium cuenoti]
MQSKYEKNVLIIRYEPLSKVVDLYDRNSMIFSYGDGVTFVLSAI